MITCAIVMCPEPRYSNGVNRPFCVKHEAEFKASPEGINLRPTSEPDFRNRIWKEECARRNQAKWDNASPEQREEWKKGGFGR